MREPNRIEFKTGPDGQGLGFTSLFGVIFTTIGVSFQFIWDNPGKLRYLFALFAFIGAHLLCYRRWIAIDGVRRTIRVQWGYLFPWRSREEPVEIYESVLVERTLSEDTSTYAVNLHSPKLDLALYQGSSRKATLEKGEQIAAFLGFNLVDKSRGETVVREPEDFGKTFKQRSLFHEGPSTLPEPPPKLLSEVEVHPQFNRIEIRFPPVGFRAGHYAEIAFGILWTGFILTFLAFYLYMEFSSDISGGSAILFRFVFIGFITLFGMIGILMIHNAFWKARKRDRLEILDREIKLYSTSPWSQTKERWWFMPMEEITEVRLIGQSDSGSVGKGLMVEIENLSGSVLQFGERLPKSELEWIREVIRTVIAKGAQPSKALEEFEARYGNKPE